MRGRVSEFGSDGWGTVAADAGSSYTFHCTAIADGSRKIEVGEIVEFEVRPGLQGRWEAADLTTVSGLPGDG
ncbi:MAG: cold-shock protein [Acidimicrobiales bacterium]